MCDHTDDADHTYFVEINYIIATAAAPALIIYAGAATGTTKARGRPAVACCVLFLDPLRRICSSSALWT